MFNSLFLSLIDHRKILDLVIITSSVLVGMYLEAEELSIGYISAWIAVKYISLYYSGTYNRFWRYTSLKDLRVTLSFILAPDILGIPFLIYSGFSLSNALMTSMLTVCALTFARVWKRHSFEVGIEKEVQRNGKRTLVFGSNKEAFQIAQIQTRKIFF